MQYLKERERKERSWPRAGGIHSARYKGALQHIGSWPIETAALCRTRNLEDGQRHNIDLVGARGASCTSSDGAAPYETGGRERAGVTAYKKERVPTLKGGQNQRLEPLAKEKQILSTSRRIKFWSADEHDSLAGL